MINKETVDCTWCFSTFTIEWTEDSLGDKPCKCPFCGEEIMVTPGVKYYRYGSL
jgi:DNA-directed RNA polymerase subunit RPC12/RpoP